MIWTLSLNVPEVWTLEGSFLLYCKGVLEKELKIQPLKGCSGCWSLYKNNSHERSYALPLVILYKTRISSEYFVSFYLYYRLL